MSHLPEEAGEEVGVEEEHKGHLQSSILWGWRELALQGLLLPMAGFHLSSMQPGQLISPTRGPWQACEGEAGPRVRSADITKRQYLLWEVHVTGDLFLP